VTFYLGTHKPGWLGVTDVPLFVSARRLRERRELPRARGRWALDSGGFSEIAVHGRWVTGPRAYAGEVGRWAVEVGGLDWAASQDWMCEPAMLGRSGLTVAEHQRRTLANYLELVELRPDLPWLPVLQGWDVADYLAHADAYERAGVEVRGRRFGLGSVCRRQATAEVARIVRELAGAGVKLHGFGVRKAGLAALAGQLASADSMAWSYRARRGAGALGCRHRRCNNCLRWALQWRGAVLALVGLATAQSPLPGMDPGCYPPAPGEEEPSPCRPPRPHVAPASWPWPPSCS
jgi:hypothetical protein